VAVSLIHLLVSLRRSVVADCPPLMTKLEKTLLHSAVKMLCLTSELVQQLKSSSYLGLQVLQVLLVRLVNCLEVER